MTPSTSLTFGGFLQGLQAEMMALIGFIIFAVVAMLIVRWYITKSLADRNMGNEEAASALAWVNRIAALLVVVALIIFVLNAATYATNAIPHTDLDKSPVYQQMDSNIKH